MLAFRRGESFSRSAAIAALGTAIQSAPLLAFVAIAADLPPDAPEKRLILAAGAVGLAALLGIAARRMTWRRLFRTCVFMAVGGTLAVAVGIYGFGFTGLMKDVENPISHLAMIFAVLCGLFVSGGIGIWAIIKAWGRLRPVETCSKK